MKKVLFAVVAVSAVVAGTVGASASSVSQFSAHLAAGTAIGQAAISAASKMALSLLGADTGFSSAANKKIADTAVQQKLTNDSQKLRSTLNADKAALKSKTSTLTVADQMASAMALQAAYKSALTSNAIASTPGNTVSYKAADGSTQSASFVLPTADVAAITAGSTATSLTGLSAYWKQAIAADSAAIKGNYDVYFMTAFSQALSANKIGCNAFNGYYSTDGATVPTFTKAGCS